MPPYPTYLQMNNPYAQMNNPYADRMNFLQNYQQSLQQPIVPTQMSGANQMSALGKMVDSIDVVKATDIPMDGNTYYFPKADGTEIFGKQWLPNGTTVIKAFLPRNEESINEGQVKENDKINVILEKMNLLEEMTSTIQNDLELIKSEKPEKKSTKSCS